jgi:hypothetical protein
MGIQEISRRKKKGNSEKLGKIQKNMKYDQNYIIKSKNLQKKIGKNEEIVGKYEKY